MKIRPLYDRVVIKRVDDKEGSMRGGLHIPDSAKEKPQEGEVMAGSASRINHLVRALRRRVAMLLNIGDQLTGSELTTRIGCLQLLE